MPESSLVQNSMNIHILRSTEFLEFCRQFSRIISMMRSVLGALLLKIVIGGWILHLVEKLGFWDAQYLAFVTALTIGYGDLSPSNPLGRITCILLGIVGMILMGLIVGAASVALRRTVVSEGDGVKKGG